jgi:hypothetical protein
MGEAYIQFAWYLDITPNEMFSLDEYPIVGKRGIPLCQEHGRQLEMKEVVVLDRIATEIAPPEHCWVCEE